MLGLPSRFHPMQIYFVLLTCCLVAYADLVSIPRLFGFSAAGITHALLFNACIAMMVVCYLAAYIADPGSIPAGWTHSLLEEPSWERKSDGGMRACSKCEHEKPPRSHHCGMLGRCVLRMDHFCPWVGNTVGAKNHKYFIQFVFYTAVSLVYAVVLYVMRIRAAMHSKSHHDGLGMWLVTVAVGFLSIPTMMSVVGLFGFQMYITAKNMTTIELMEGGRWAADGKPHPKVIYDHGILHNLKMMFGTNPISWFFPVGHVMDGFNFKPRCIKYYNIYGEEVPPPDEEQGGSELREFPVESDDTSNRIVEEDDKGEQTYVFEGKTGYEAGKPLKRSVRTEDI